MLINKKSILYFLFTISLFLGFFFEENSSGGARYDHNYFSETIKNFSVSLHLGFEMFVKGDGGIINGSIIHSPGFYIIISLLLKLFDELIYIQIIYLIICSSLPYIIFLILKNNFKVKNEYIFYLSLIIFLSPYFRSSAIWLLGDNLGLIFFSLSVLFYLKTKNEKEKISNYYLCFLFLILCCYIRYYYCVFSIYFLYHIYRNINLRSFLFLIMISFILSIPAFYYLYIVISNYNFLGTLFSFGSVNIYSNSLIILSIILFYLLPFIFFNKLSIFKYYHENVRNIFFLLIPILIIYFLDKFLFLNIIEFSYRGGGVFFKIFNLLNLELELFISLVAFLSLITLDFLFKGNRLRNYFLLFLLICCFPLVTIYQKYIDPLIYLMIFGLINSEYLKEIMTKGFIKINFIFIYFLSFYIITFSYYYFQGV